MVSPPAAKKANGKPSHDDIMGALTESGYLMEQEVASKLEAIGYHVQTNVAFEDPDEGKSREIDVNAIQRIYFDEENKFGIFIQLLIECKNSSNPHVFITRNKNQADRNEPHSGIVFPVSYEQVGKNDKGQAMHRRVPAFMELKLDEDHYYYRQAEKAVQFCRVDRKGAGWQANHGGTYDGIIFPLVKAFESRKSKLPKARDKDDWHYVWILIPTVVIRGDLFSVDSASAAPSPIETAHITLLREIKSKNLNGKYLIEFVNENEINKFVQDKVEPFAAAIARIASEDMDGFKQKRRPWSDFVRP